MSTNQETLSRGEALRYAGGVASRAIRANVEFWKDPAAAVFLEQDLDPGAVDVRKRVPGRIRRELQSIEGKGHHEHGGGQGRPDDQPLATGQDRDDIQERYRVLPAGDPSPRAHRLACIVCVIAQLKM